MNYETAIEHVKVICAPPGSIIVLSFKDRVHWQEREQTHTRLAERFPEYRWIITSNLDSIHAIAPQEPPPVTNNYTVSVLGNGVPDEHVRNAIKQVPR